MSLYIRFAELPVADQDRAIKFYTENLGFRVAQDSPYQEGWRWISLEIPGARTKLLFTRRTDQNAREDVPSLTLTVNDVQGMYEELKTKGVVFTTEPTQASWNEEQTYAELRDSEGNIVLLVTEA